MPQPNPETATETSSKASPIPARLPAFTPRSGRKMPGQIRELENSTSPRSFSAASKPPSSSPKPHDVEP